MRLIFQGFGLAVVALVCFTLSGVQFWQEHALHQNLIVVQAKITNVSQPSTHYRYSYSRRGWRGAYGLPSQPSMSFEFTLAGAGVHRVNLHVPVAYSFAHHLGDLVPLRVNAADPQQAELRPDGYAIGGLAWGIAGMSAAALSVLAFGTAYAGLLKRAQAAAPQAPRPKAQLRRVYWRG